MALLSRDFKSLVSAYSTTTAYLVGMTGLEPAGLSDPNRAFFQIELHPDFTRSIALFWKKDLCMIYSEQRYILLAIRINDLEIFAGNGRIQTCIALPVQSRSRTVIRICPYDARLLHQAFPYKYFLLFQKDKWYRRWDLNPYDIATSGFWVRHVCQFHHYGIFWQRLNICRSNIVIWYK